MASYPTRMRLTSEFAAAHKCESQKRGYLTKAEALDAAERLMEQGRVSRGCHLTPYLCECRSWHIFNRRIVQLRGRWV